MHKRPNLRARGLGLTFFEYIQLQSLRAARKGLLLTAYSTDESLLRRKFLPEAAQLARSSKKFNSFLVCIVTNANVTEFAVDGAFDYFIPVRSSNLIAGEERSGGYEPQWFTRLVHLSASPFRVTLTLDSDAGFCGRIDEPFKQLEGFDFVVSNHVKDHVPGCAGEYPHNFMMGYVLSVNTKILFSNWLRRRLFQLFTRNHESFEHICTNRSSSTRIRVENFSL